MSAARPQAIVVGASAGAVQALSVILSRLPANYSLPVLVVVHVPEGPSGLLPLFANKSAIAFREPEDKEPIAPATVYIAPPGYHMLVEAGLSIALSTNEPVLFSRPSIDVLFESAADSYGSGLTGIVLTGANDDGARGAAAISRSGGIVLVEDPATAYASAMPTAALARCANATTMSLDAIAEHLLELGRS